MPPLRKTDTAAQRPAVVAKPTGEKFDATTAFAQAQQLYPKVMAKLAE